MTTAHANNGTTESLTKNNRIQTHDDDDHHHDESDRLNPPPPSSFSNENGDDVKCTTPSVVAVTAATTAVCNGQDGKEGMRRKEDRSVRTRRPPDGGFYAWLVCMAVFWTNGAIFGVINSEGVLHVRLLEMYGGGNDTDSSFKISLVGSLSIGTTFLLSPVAAILTDSFGIWQTAFVGSILVVAGMFFSSLVKSLGWLYVTYGLMLGIGASLAYTPSLVILGHYFSKRLGFVNGLATAGSSVFTMVLPFVMRAMLDSVQLSGTFMLLSAVVLLLVPCSLLFRPLRPITSPDGAGADVDNGHATVKSKQMGRSKIVNTSIWRNRKYMVWAMAFPVSLFGYFVPYVHLINHVRIILPDYSGEALITCIAAASMVGRIVFGQLADFKGVSRIQLQQLSFFSLGVLTMLLSIANHYWMLIIICLGLGIFDGCFISLIGPIAFEVVGHKGASQAIGFLLGICSVPLTLGPPIAGWLYDHTGKSYEVSFLVAGLPPVIGSLLMFVINRVNQPELSPETTVINGDDRHRISAVSSPDERSKLTSSVTTETRISPGLSNEDDAVWKLQEKGGHHHVNGDSGTVPDTVGPDAKMDHDDQDRDQVRQNKGNNSIITERESAI